MRSRFFLSTYLLLCLTIYIISISTSAIPLHVSNGDGSHKGGVSVVTPSDSMSSIDLSSAASSVVPNQRYPRDLHRLYDGTWEVNGPFPFTSIPSPRDSRISGDSLSRNNNTVSALSLSNASSHASGTSISDLTFTKKSGFALLTAENQVSELGPDLNIVFGELLLRDGAYRSRRDVSFRLIGIYRWATGTMVVVGDELFEETTTSLQRLYRTYDATISSNSPTNSLNITEEAFISALSPRFAKHRKQFRAQRSGATRHPTVAAQCPFSITFNIERGNFNDQFPRENESSGTSSHNNSPSSTNNGRSTPPTGAGLFDTVRPPANMLPRENGTFSMTQKRELNSGLDLQGSGLSKDELVEMKGLFKSDVCNTKMTIILSTLDTERLVGKAINYTLLVTIVAFIQVIVLIRQMEMTSTQACARRVSLMTVGLQAVADSYLCLGHLTMGIAVQPLFNAFATAAFFKFICFSIFLMRWMLLIWKARRPEGFADGWDAMRRELSMLYSRFYGSLLLGIFLLYQMQNQLRFFLFLLYSFWVPQIVLNVVGDYRRPLLPSYIIGTSLTRLVIPMYFWVNPHNFLHIKPQPISAIALVVWLLSQALILLSQYKFGPRWFIPKKLLPERYDYYRPIVLENETNGTSNDIEAQDGREQEPLVGGNADTRRECCICMETVDIHSPDRMVTPCNHFFHAKCLEQWLEVRLECALCRTRVPQI